MDRSPFVGASRESLVDGLVDLFGNVCASGEPRWVSLEAPSGWGKTRVGKEFYARLAEEKQSESSPKYWPATIGDMSRTERKLVSPSGDREAGSLPTYLWWGLSCSTGEHSALRDGLDWLTKHGKFVSIACNEDKPRGERAIKNVVEQRWQFAQESALEAAGQMAGVAGVVIPGMGLLALMARLGTNAIRSHQTKKKMVAEASDLGSTQSELVEGVVDGLCDFGRSRFPVVLFVEDVHYASNALLEALEALMRRGSHLMVVTTAMPGKLDETPELPRLLESLGDRALRVGHQAPAGPPFAAEAGLTEFNSADCKRIVCAHYPDAEKQTVALLAERYRNPYALELVCDMGRYRRRYGERGDLRIAPHEIESLPVGTEELYRAYWDELPEWLRLRYAVAAAISPAAISPVEGRGDYTWSDPVLKEVAESLDLPSVSDLRNAIEAAADAYGWVVHVDEYLRRWCETDQQYIAADAGRNLLARETTVARDDILAEVARVVLRDGSPSVHAARMIIALHNEGFITDHAPIAQAIAVVLNYLSYDDTAIAERESLYNLYVDLDSTSIEAETDLEVRLNGINAVEESGKYDLAADAYLELRAQTASRHGPQDPRSLRVSHDLAGASLQAGRLDQAIDLFEQVLADSIQAHGPDDTLALHSRLGLAAALADAGRNDESIKRLDQALAMCLEVLGLAHPLTWHALHGLGAMLALRGTERHDEAITMLELAVAQRAIVLGEDHPDTLGNKYDLAMASAAVDPDRSEEAADTVRQVRASCIRVLGEKHPQTLTAGHGLGRALREAGQHDEAIDILQLVLSQHVQVLGGRNARTVATQQDLGSAQLLARRFEEAMETFEQVVNNALEVLGPTHPDTFASRNLLTVASLNARHLDNATTNARQTLAEVTQALGPDHSHTQLARKLAVMLGIED